jgi:hypothetical protein
MTYFYPVIHYRSRGNGVDLSNDTVEPQYLLNGYTAHNLNYSSITGIYDPIDLSMDTVSPETLVNVYTAHNANGVSIIGTMESSNGGDDNFEMVYKLKLNT